MLNKEKPNTGDYHVRKVLVYLTEDTLKKEERWDKLDVLSPLYKGSNLYLCDKHFEILKYVENTGTSHWEDETSASDIKELAKELCNRDVKNLEQIYNCNMEYDDDPFDDHAFSYVTLSSSEWTDLERKLEESYDTRAGAKAKQLEFPV